MYETIVLIVIMNKLMTNTKVTCGDGQVIIADYVLIKVYCLPLSVNKEMQQCNNVV